MAWLNWLTTHWFDLLQTLGIVGGLFFTGWSLHSDAKAQRATNLLKLTEQHHSLWMMHLTNPKLVRILDDRVDLRCHPLTDDESRFVGLLFWHLNWSYYAIKANVLTKPEGLAADIQSFFALPIPQTVWQQSQHLFNADFVKFVESQRGT